MQAFSFKRGWVPGNLHLIADSLSRTPLFLPHTEEPKCFGLWVTAEKSTALLPFLK